MTNKEAIAELKAMPIIYPITNGENDRASRLMQARDMAIKALKQEPCEDAISREDALLCLTGEYLENYAYDELIAKFARRIKALPSSQPDIEAMRQEIEQAKIGCEQQMRPATPEERQGEKEYIDSISDPTGVNFNDLLKVEDKPQGEEKNICDSCGNKACIFDSHVKRQKCDFYKPQPKTGHWIDNKCSVCGKGIEDLIDSREWYRNKEPNFCPFCGLKLVDSQEREG